MNHQTKESVIDLRNYQDEITQMRMQVEEASCRVAWQILGSGVLGLVEWGVRRPLAIRKSLNDKLVHEQKALEERRSILKQLEEQGLAVQAAQGDLAYCAKCRKRIRTRFAVSVDQAKSDLLGTCRAGWYCPQCGEPILETYKGVALCYAQYKGVFKGAYVPGVTSVKRLGWIATQDEHDTVEDVCEELKLIAARMGGNACVEFWYDMNKDRQIAGYSERGNPFYRTVVTFAGKACAVRIDY